MKMWKFNDHHIAYPFTIKVAGGKEESCSVVLDFFRSNEEREEGRELMNAEITSGLSWPFDARFESQVMVMWMVNSPYHLAPILKFRRRSPSTSSRTLLFCSGSPTMRTGFESVLYDIA